MPLTDKLKYEIIFLHERGYTNRSIASELKINRNTVERWIKRYKNTGSIVRKEGSGRCMKTTEEDNKKIIQSLKENKYLTSIDIQRKLEYEGIIVSDKTIRNRLKKNGYTYGKAPKEPLIKEKHKRDRILWARQNMETNWKTVLFSDETYVIKGSNGQVRWYNKDDPTDVDFIVKHPFKINIWGCIKYNGPNRIHIFEGIMDAEKYMEILNSNILDLLVTENDLIFQDDNDPRHRSKLIKDWKRSYNLMEYNWPPNSPDLNPIENVWNLLKGKINKAGIISNIELIKCIEEKWNEIDKETINSIIESMPERILKVIQKEGNYINY